MTHRYATDRTCKAPSIETTGPPRPGRVLVVMCAGMFLVLLDVTAVNVALPSIGAGLHTGVQGLQWVVDAYAVAIAGLLLFAGTIGDRIGHRQVVLLGFAVFGLASIVCAVAPNLPALVSGRGVQGVGAALLLPGTMALIAETYPDRAMQSRALGTWAAVSSLALPAGPLIGGALVSLVSWRLVFWVNVPITIVVVAVVPALIPARRGRRGLRLDLAGSIGPVVALCAGVFAVIQAGHRGAIEVVLTAAAIAVCAMVITVLLERRHPDPALPLGLLSRGSFAAPNVVAALINLVFNGTLFVTTLYLQQSRGLSPLLAGVAVLPMAVPLVLLAPLSGWLTSRHGPRLAVGIGCSLGILGGLLLLTVPAHGSLGWIIGSIGVTALGGGMTTTSVVTAAIQAAPANRAGLATGVSNTARQVGTASGVAVFGAIAGSPLAAGVFVHRIHILAAVSAGLWLAALAMTLRWVATHQPRGVATEPVGIGRQ